MDSDDESRVAVVLSQIREQIRNEVKQSGVDCIRSRFDTSDIVQETMVQIWCQLKKTDLMELEMTRGLLRVIARGHANKMKRFHLAKRRNVTQEVNSAPENKSSATNPVFMAEVREQIRLLIEALGAIHPVRQLIVFRRFFDDQSFKEIGLELDKNRDWIRRQYIRALRELKVLMQEK